MPQWNSFWVTESYLRLNDNSNFSDLFATIATSSNSETEFEDCIDMLN